MRRYFDRNEFKVDDKLLEHMYVYVMLFDNRYLVIKYV